MYMLLHVHSMYVSLIMCVQEGIRKSSFHYLFNRILSQAASTTVSVGSIIAMWQTKDDVLYKK